MSAEFTIVLLSAVLKDDDLVVFAMLNNFSRYSRPFNIRSTDNGAVIFTEKDNLVKCYLCTLFSVDFLKPVPPFLISRGFSPPRVYTCLY